VLLTEFDGEARRGEGDVVIVTEMEGTLEYVRRVVGVKKVEREADVDGVIERVIADEREDEGDGDVDFDRSAEEERVVVTDTEAEIFTLVVTEFERREEEEEDIEEVDEIVAS